MKNRYEMCFPVGIFMQKDIHGCFEAGDPCAKCKIMQLRSAGSLSFCTGTQLEEGVKTDAAYGQDGRQIGCFNHIFMIP